MEGCVDYFSQGELITVRSLYAATVELRAI